MNVDGEYHNQAGSTRLMGYKKYFFHQLCNIFVLSNFVNPENTFPLPTAGCLWATGWLQPTWMFYTGEVLSSSLLGTFFGN